MIENSQYVSLQNYINKSNIVITSKNRPHSRIICDIALNSNYTMQEVPMRYIRTASEPPKGIVKENNNYYNRLNKVKHNMYTKYIMNVSILPKDDMIKRYEDISAYNKLCQAEDDYLKNGYVDLIVKTMNRFNYIVDNSCNIINSGYGKDIFKYKRKRKEKTKLGKLLYDISSYYIGDGDIVNSSLFNVSTMKFDPSILFNKETKIEDIIDVSKIRLHYLKKIQNKMLYWIPIIRTTKKPKRPLRVYEKMSNRQSYRYKRMGYNKKIVNADVFNAFNNKQFYFPLKTYVKRITSHNDDGIIVNTKYEDPSATIKSMIYDPSIHSINQISNVEKDSIINASLDILEMIFGKSAPLSKKKGVSTDDKNIYTNNLSFFPIYESIGDKIVVSSSTNNFYERCSYGISNRDLIRYRTYDSCTNIVIPSNKFKRSIKFNKHRSKKTDRSMYKIYFDLGIAIIDKNGRQYKTSSKVKKISLNILNNDYYILPSLKYSNPSVYKYLNVIDDISINGGDKFIRYSSLIGGTTYYFAWSELNTKDIQFYVPETYDGKHEKHKIMEMSYDRFARISNGFAMIPTVLQMEQFITEHNNKSFELHITPTPKVEGETYNVYVGNSIDSSNNVLFRFSPLDGESSKDIVPDGESNKIIVHSEVKFWTRSLYDNDNAYVIIFNIDIEKDDGGKFIDGKVNRIHINTLPVYKGAKILPIIQYNTCDLKYVSIKGESVKDISLNKPVLNLKTWQSEKLIAEIIPENASNKEVVWVSSNPSIATVNKYGNVKALSRKGGTVTITANSSANSAISTTCIVNVSSYRNAYITDDNFVKMYDSDTDVRWAKYNLGVDPDKLDDLYGYKFAWSENMPKNEYTIDNYKPIHPDNDLLTYDEPKYQPIGTHVNTSAQFNHTNVDIIDDPAGYMLHPNPTYYNSIKKMGYYDAYKVPTDEDFAKLLDNSKKTVDIKSIGNISIYGIKFTSTAAGYENASIFIPTHTKNLIIGGKKYGIKLWTNLKSKCLSFEITLKTSGQLPLYKVSSTPMYSDEWCGLYVRPIVEKRKHANRETFEQHEYNEDTRIIDDELIIK